MRTFFSRHPCLSFHVSPPILSCPKLCSVSEQCKVLHSTQIASHRKIAFYILCMMLVLRERLGKMQGSTGSDLEYLTKKVVLDYLWFFLVFCPVNLSYTEVANDAKLWNINKIKLLIVKCLSIKILTLPSLSLFLFFTLLQHFSKL